MYTVETKKNKPIRLLLADSSVEQLWLWQSYLARQPGFEVLGAYTQGDDLLRGLKSADGVELLVADLTLRDMEALKLLGGLQALPPDKQPAHIVITSSLHNDVYLNRLNALGVDLVLFKPCSMNLLFDRAAFACRDTGGAARQTLLEKIRGHLAGMNLNPAKRDCLYLLYAVRYIVCADENCAIVKEVYGDVAHQQGVSPSAVECGIRRALAQARNQRSPSYCRAEEAILAGGARSVSNGALLKYLAAQVKAEISVES